MATNVHFTLSSLTVANGKVTGANGSTGSTGSSGGSTGGTGGTGVSGGNALGGGMINSGFTTLIDCVFLSNNCTAGAGGTGGHGGNGSGSGGDGGSGGAGGNALGGGIYNYNSLVISNCDLELNSVVAGNGGVGGTNGTGGFAFVGGGGTGGTAQGAAIYSVAGANVTVFGVTFQFNSGQGGNTQTAAERPQSNGNGQPGQTGGSSVGGAICNLGTNSVVNCTFYENQVTGGNGGKGGDGTSHAGNGGNGGSGLGANFYNSGFTAITKRHGRQLAQPMAALVFIHQTGPFLRNGRVNWISRRCECVQCQRHLRF